MAKNADVPVTEDVIQDVPDEQVAMPVDTDEGTNPLVRALPELDVTVYDQSGNATVNHYRMGPMGLNEAFKAIRVISRASDPLSRLPPETLQEPQGVMFAIIGTIPYAENDIKSLVAGVMQFRSPKGHYVPVSVAQLEDPKMFPLDSFIDIIEAFSEHPDLASFLKNVTRLAKNPLLGQTQKGIQNQAKQ